MRKSCSHEGLSGGYPGQPGQEATDSPHTLPPNTKPPPVPRKPLRKTVSSQSVGPGNQPQKPRPVPRSRSRRVTRDAPLPLPRKPSCAVQQAQAANVADHDYAEPKCLPPTISLLHELDPHASPKALARSHMHSSPPLTLRELSEMPHHLPATIETIDGYLGFGHQFTISTGDLLCAHFVKHVKMVVLQDRVGLQFHVPLSSAMKFGFYQDKTEPEEFVKVSDMAKQKNGLPRVICCEKYIPAQARQEAVDQGDTLIVKGYRSHGSRAGLICHSLRRDQEVMLLKSCRGSFTTAPEKTCMYLLDIVTHLAELLPCKVHLYPPAGHKRHDLFTRGRIFTLKEYTTVTSLVVSNVNSTNSKLFDIVLDKDLSELRVSVLNTAPERVAQQHSASTFWPGHYTQLIKTTEFQQSLYTTLRPGLEAEGVKVAHSQAEGGSEYAYISMWPRYYPSADQEHRSRPEQSREDLRSLSMHEVSLLLSAMGMEQYKDTFLQEQVSGSFLAACKQTTLEHYLKISNPKHLQQLLSIIAGDTSAKKILSQYH